MKKFGIMKSHILQIISLRLCYTVLLAILLHTNSAYALENIHWRFESEGHKWRTSSSSSSLMTEFDSGATAGSSSYLRLSGSSNKSGDWNHAISEIRAVAPSSFYRLEGWIKVDEIEPSGQYPALKCEFIGKDGSTVIGRAFAESYDGTREKTWQRLSCELRIPSKASYIRIALDKGAITPEQRDLSIELDCTIDEISLVPIDNLSVSGQFDLNPIPDTLKQLYGVHPRLYLTPETQEELRISATTTYNRFFSVVKQRADNGVKSGPPEYTNEIQYRFPGDEGIGGFQQLWQRNVGDNMVDLATAWIVTGDKRYLESARDWAIASCGYDYWGLCWIDGMELAAAHQIFGLSIVYDWCYNDLDINSRNIIKETLIQRSAMLFQAVASEKQWFPRTMLPKFIWANWYHSYLSNHQWIPMCALASAGVALYDEEPYAKEWIALSQNKFHNVMEALGPDGASHEGASYFGYGVEWLLKYMYLSRQLLDDDLFDTEWFRKTVSYRLNMSLPRNAWTRQNNVVDIGDSGRSDGPDYQLYGLAKVYGDGYAQWLADEIYATGFGAARNRWLGLFFYNPDLKPVHPRNLPAHHHFRDMGIVSTRSDWSGNESLLVLKCGPYMGHEALETKPFRFMLNDADDQHVHPDANHFVLFGNGEWLLRDDTGHRSKWTNQHNTLVIDGRGQLGEGWWYFKGLEPYLHKARPRITHTMFSPAFDHIAGDATEAYPTEAGLTRFVRHLLYIKPDVLIVIDDIELDAAGALELRFHPEHHSYKQTGNTITFDGENTLLRMEPLTSDGVSIDTAWLPAEGWHGRPDSLLTVRCSATRSKWRNAVALSWKKKEITPAEVSLTERDEKWIFTIKDRTVEFNWADNKAHLMP
ncbi:DUF4962 domain-containing protein [Candidatus Latescibacterota bacterium]